MCIEHPWPGLSISTFFTIDIYVSRIFQVRETFIFFQNLNKTYTTGNACKPKKQGKLKAVKNICIEVQPGEVFGLLGPNGAGKTSTLKIITAEQAPSNGKVIYSEKCYFF